MGQVHFCASARLYYLEDSLLCFEFQPCIKDICQYMCMSWSIPWRGMLKCQFRNATLQTLTRNCWVQYEVKMAERIQPNLTYPMGIGSWRALNTSLNLLTQVEVASWHATQVCRYVRYAMKTSWRMNITYLSHDHHISKGNSREIWWLVRQAW